MQSGGQQAGYPMHIVSPQQKTSVACFSPRFVCVAVLGLLALCLGRLVHALAALSVPVDVTHFLSSRRYNGEMGITAVITHTMCPTQVLLLHRRDSLTCDKF